MCRLKYIYILGFIAEAPVAENGKVILRYRFDNGSCGTEIEFSCDEEGLVAFFDLESQL